MEIIDYKENEDGSANLTIDMNEEEENVFLRLGMQALIDKEFGGKAKVIPYTGDLKSEKRKTFEVDDDLAEEYVKIGIVEALKQGIEREKAPEEKAV